MPQSIQLEALIFLMRRRFPDHELFKRRHAKVKQFSTTSQSLDAKLQAIEEYERQLKSMPEGEFSALHQRELAKMREEEQAKAQEAELQRIFNQPSAAADFDHWSRAAYWSLEEAVALSFGKEPALVNWSSLKQYINQSPFAVRYQKVLDLAVRATATKKLFNPVFPGIFLDWTKSNQIDFPAILEEKLAAHGQRATDWKSLYSRLKTQSDESTASSKSAIAEKDASITTLKAALAAAELRITELGVNAKEKPLGTKERESLLKLVIGMAVAGYTFDPKSARNAATQEIADDLTKLGVPLDEDTVRKWLKEAAELLPEQDKSND